MKVFLISALLFILLRELVLFSRNFYVQRKFKRLALDKYKRVEPLLHQLASNGEIADTDLQLIAGDPSLRCGLFKMLDTYNKTELFPSAYFTIEKGAEGYLVNWLEFPTELGNAPDEINVIEKITLHEGAIDYYAFKFRSQLPHWAKQLNWMVGVSGPYQKNSKPYDVPVRVFSRFNRLGSITPAMEVEWVHRNINPNYEGNALN